MICEVGFDTLIISGPEEIADRILPGRKRPELDESAFREHLFNKNQKIGIINLMIITFRGAPAADGSLFFISTHKQPFSVLLKDFLPRNSNQRSAFQKSIL